MIKKIEEFEQPVYLAIFGIGLYFGITVLKIIGLGLILMTSIRSYIRTKRLKNFLTLLLILAVSIAIAIRSIIPDFDISYSVLFYFILFAISFMVKTFLATKIHYNQKFWGYKSLVFVLLVSIVVTGYYLALGSFAPTFTGDKVFKDKNKFTIYYDDTITEGNIKLLVNSLEEYEYLYWKENTAFRLTDEYDYLKLQLYQPEFFWNNEDVLELFEIYQKELNEIGLSKKLKIFLVANTIFELKEKPIVTN